MAKNIEFDILAHDRASKTFDKVGKSSDGLGSKLGGLGKIGAAAVGGAAVGGIVALGAAMVNGVKDAASYQTLANKTAAVLKSTGNAANQSVKGIQARAGALESLSGVDEELIINGQNVLATFTSIRDGVGKGNDIFNQATTAALDMSSALGTDLQGATIQLGKALNDPIKGITALSRVGVSFTKGQKDQIKTMVKAGDTMGAQKLILKELNKEFGGAARAAGQGFNGAMARAKDAVQDAFRSIGTKLLPSLTKLADYIAANAGPWIDRLSQKIGVMWRWVSGSLWPALQKGYQTVMPALKSALATVTGGVNGGTVSWRQIGAVITGKVIPFLSTLAAVYLPMVARNIRIMIDAVRIAWSVFITFRDVIARVISFIVGKFASLMGVWASVLRALGRVPGFGWARDAAAKMQTAADKARGISRAIGAIPSSKNVSVNVTTLYYERSVGSAARRPIKPAERAVGGPVQAGHPYIVGEREPELFIPDQSGRILNQRQMKAAGAGASGVGGGDTFNATFVLPAGTSDAQAEALWAAFLRLKRRRGVNLGLA